MPNSEDDSIQIEVREISEEEELQKAFMESLKGAMATDYGTFAGITSMKLVLHSLLNDPKDLQETAAKLSGLWMEEAEEVLYPDFSRRKAQILETHPKSFEGIDLDQVFQDALQETAKLIEGTLLEGEISIRSLLPLDTD